jgi:hypothetical protein
MSVLHKYAEMNEAFYDQLQTPGLEKHAADSVSEFTRSRVREEGFYDKIIPEVQVANSDLTRQVDTPKPVIVVDKEAESPAAVSMPFGSLSSNWYIRGPRYRVEFDRILTRRFVSDLDELRTWQHDIRQVLSDNSVRDMLAEQDSKFITALNTALVGADEVNPLSGVVQWETIYGGISRDTLEEAFAIMPKTPSHCEVATVLCNTVTRRRVQAFTREEVGGDKSQEWFLKGWTTEEVMGVPWIFTIKRDLVPDDSLFLFGDPRFIGKNFVLEATTMHVKREAFFIEWFAYKSLGGAIGHTGALARADFA